MFLLNNTIENDAAFSEKDFESGLSIYEVIRIFHSKPIFLQDNLLRLDNSLKKSNIDIDVADLHIPDKLNKLIKLTNMQEGNLKYVLCFTDVNQTDEYIYQIPHSYPTEENYQNGITTVTCHAVRETPEIKYINGELRTLTNQLMKDRNAYEILLTDNENYITEGSRSNVFFIRENTLYTASTAYVLPGTSRKRVFDICKQHQIPLEEKRVSCRQLNQYDAAFITGTSPLILPIRMIDSTPFNVRNPLLRKLMEYYFALIESVSNNGK